MAADYLVPAGFGEAEYVDKKSRFIARVSRAETEEAAMEFIEGIRRANADATHNVWAYHLKNGALRWSDDGEPGGTSGQPTLNVFRSAEVFDAVCVVTRYFGGILLGSGGLVRAYSKAASLALEAAGLARMALWRRIAVVCGYPQYERARRLLEELGAEEIDAQFGAEVSVSALLPESAAEVCGARLTELSAGSARFTVGAELYRPARIK